MGLFIFGYLPDPFDQPDDYAYQSYSTMNCTESEIIQNAKSGDTSAFRKLVEHYQPFAYALAYRMTRSHDEAQDIVQDSFIRCWQAIGRFDQRVKFSTWLYKIVMNRCLDLFKSSRFKSRHYEIDFNVGYGVHDPKRSDELLHQQEFLEIVLKMSQQLTPKQRAVFVLRDLEDLDVTEVSSILSMSHGKIKSNLYYARKKMSELLSKIYQNTSMHEL